MGLFIGSLYCKSMLNVTDKSIRKAQMLQSALYLNLATRINSTSDTVNMT